MLPNEILLENDISDRKLDLDTRKNWFLNEDKLLLSRECQKLDDSRDILNL